MADSAQGAAAVDDAAMHDVEEPITARVVLSGFAGGILGLVAMAPVIAGIPMVLGIFEAEPLAEFARFIITEAGATLGIAFFAVGGAFVLPLFFVVTASFLPPRDPKWMRGVTMSVFFWTSFVFIFLPNGTLAGDAAFAVITLVAHCIYGGVLGVTLLRLTGIPEHDV